MASEDETLDVSVLDSPTEELGATDTMSDALDAEVTDDTSFDAGGPTPCSPKGLELKKKCCLCGWATSVCDGVLLALRARLRQAMSTTGYLTVTLALTFAGCAEPSQAQITHSDTAPTDDDTGVPRADGPIDGYPRSDATADDKDSGDTIDAGPCFDASTTDPHCPPYCFRVDGAPADLARKCFLPIEVLGCSPSGGTGSVKCIVRRSDGAFYRLPSATPVNFEWRLCREEEKAAVDTCTAPCPTSDAGAPTD